MELEHLCWTDGLTVADTEIMCPESLLLTNGAESQAAGLTSVHLLVPFNAEWAVALPDG